MFIVKGVVLLMQNIPFEEEISRIGQNVLSLDIAEPTVFLIKILIDGLATLIDGDWLAGSCVCFFKILLTA